MAPAPPPVFPLSVLCAGMSSYTHTHTRMHTRTHAHLDAHTRAQSTHQTALLQACLWSRELSACWEGWGRRKRWGSPLINYLRHSGVGLPSAICLRYGRELEKGGGGESAREEEKRKEETLERNRKANGIQEERLFTLKELAWGGGGTKR